MNRLFIPGAVLALMLAPHAQRTARAADGDLDVTFGTAGKVRTDFATSYDSGSAIVTQADGKIVAAGTNFEGIGGADFAVARYNPDGSLDATFGTGGKVLTDIAVSYDDAAAVAVQSDGKIVVAGRTMTGGSNDDFGLVRYNSDGTLDSTFGVGGKVHTDFGATFFEQANAIAIQADGKIVAAGQTYTGATGTDFALVRYNVDGSVDTSFGTGGIVTTNFAGATYDRAFAIVIQSDGKIVAAGDTAPVGGNADFALARYNADGSLDASFGGAGGGKVSTDLAGASSDLAYAVAVQRDGKIVAAGETFSDASGTGTDFAVVRYNLDGSLDGTFGTGGAVRTDFAISADQAYGVAIQADGKIVAAGFTFVQNVPGGGDFGVVRYNINGTLDTTFGSGGRVTTDFAVSFDSAMGMTLQADGKILVIGSTFGLSAIGASDFAIARYEGPPPAHTLTFFLHGNDVAGTAGGFTMDQSPPSHHTLVVSLPGAASWFSEPAVNGTFIAGAAFKLALPCPIGVSLPKTITLSATDADGGNAQLLGQAAQGPIICYGERDLSIAIPVTAPVTLTNRRLKLTIASPVYFPAPLLLGDAFLEATNFSGTP